MVAESIEPQDEVRLLTPAERGAQLERFSRESDREQSRDTIRTLASCAVYSAAGILGLSWAVASRDEAMARVIFWMSLAVANAGILITLIAAYARSVERTGMR